MKPRGGLPDITFADTSSSTIVANSVAAYEKITGESLAPADPRRVFIQSLCTIIIQIKTVASAARNI